MLKIVLVEDEVRSREGLKRLLDKYPKLYTVVGEASNGTEGYHIIKQTMPDVVISDIKMPFCDGITMLKNLRGEGINCKFILLTGYAEFEYAKEAIRYQVEYYILKPMIVTDILDVLEKIRTKSKKREKEFLIQDQIREYLRMKRGDINDIMNNIKNYFNSPDIPILYTLIYISSVFKERKKSILEIINEFCKKNISQWIIVDMEEQKIFIISKDHERDASAQFLINLNKLLNCNFKKGIGVLYTYKSCVDTLIQDYKTLEEKLPYLLSMGTNDPLCIEEINIQKKVKENKIVQLEKSFTEELYNQNYQQCMNIIDLLIEKLKEYRYDPEEILHVFHSLFIQLNQHMKTFQSNTSFLLYNKLIGELSVGKTEKDIIAPFEKILKLLEEEKKLAKPYSLLIQKTMSKINKNYMNPISLQGIADSLGVTHIYLSQLFHKEVKKSFKEYLIDVRMKQAEKLLKTTDLKVYEVALQVGYSDPRYFCTQFKKYIGLSPARYQQSKLEP